MIAAFELLLFIIVIAFSVFAVSTFLLKHQKKNDKLRKQVGALFLEENNKNNKN